MKKTEIAALVVPILFIVASRSAMAQSTIFNVPTTDTVQKGKTYFEFDFLPQLPAPESGGTHVYNLRVVVGVASNVEAGANFLTAHSTHGAHLCGQASTCGYFQPNIKYRYYNNDTDGVAAAAGILWNTPINQRD